MTDFTAARTGAEIPRGQGMQEKESNLSSNARLVLDTITRYVSGENERMGFVRLANELHRKKEDGTLRRNDPGVGEYENLCGILKEAALEAANADNADHRVLVIIENYYNRSLADLLRGIE